MIEVVDREQCIGCDRCIDVCPTRVFDRDVDGYPVIARPDVCQTCFQCEAYCPTDALFVAPQTSAVEAGSHLLDVVHLREHDLLGSYRHELGWGGGRPLGARTAFGPELPR